MLCTLLLDITGERVKVEYSAKARDIARTYGVFYIGIIQTFGISENRKRHFLTRNVIGLSAF